MSFIDDAPPVFEKNKGAGGPTDAGIRGREKSVKTRSMLKEKNFLQGGVFLHPGQGFQRRSHGV